MTEGVHIIDRSAARPLAKNDVKMILKSELKRRGLTYADLVRLLGEHGVPETEANLRNKMSRGSFTAAFFIQCLVVIGCHQVQITLPERVDPPA